MVYYRLAFGKLKKTLREQLSWKISIEIAMQNFVFQNLVNLIMLSILIFNEI